MAIVINSTTGEIDLDATTPAIYEVTYTVDGVSSTQEVTVNALDNAAFSYSASSYAPTDADPTPTITGLTGGTFSGSTGLVINSTTGEIDLSASTVASHTITYNTSSSGSSVCPNTSTQNVEIALAGIANNYSMSFDGSNDYINLSNNSIFNLGTSFTVSGWFNFDLNKYQGLISFDSSSTRGWFLYQISGTNDIKLFDGSSAVTLKSSYTTTNQWDSFIVTYDGTDLVFYINGIQESTQAVSINPQTNGNDGQIGNNQAGSGRYFNGKIDEVAIWNTALTSTQIQSIYDAKGTNLTKDLTTVSGSNLKYWNRMGD